MRLLRDNRLQIQDGRKGKFRSYLLAALNHFLINEWQRGQRQKRGRGAVIIALDKGDAEARYRLEPADENTPDKLYDRAWAEALLARVLDQLRRECGGRS